MHIPESIIHQAARLFGTRSERLHLLGGMDGLAYAFEREERWYVLKVAPAGAEGRLAEMSAKFDFVDYLAENGARAARPLRSMNGVWVELIAGEEGGYTASSAVKAPGHHPGEPNRGELTPAFFQSWGRVMGRMHALAKAYTARSQSAIGDWRGELEHFTHWTQDAPVRARWQEMGRLLEALPQTREDIGLIHNDMHPANFLLEAGQITVIDFDVCAHHFFAKDIAIPLFFANWGGPPDPHQPRGQFLAEFFAAFMHGYSRENTPGDAWSARMPLFLAHHRLLLYTFFSEEAWKKPDPWQRNQLSAWRKGILSGAPVVEMEF